LTTLITNLARRFLKSSSSKDEVGLQTFEKNEMGGVRLGFARLPQKLGFAIDKWQAMLADDATAYKALVFCTVFYLNGLVPVL